MQRARLLRVAVGLGLVAAALAGAVPAAAWLRVAYDGRRPCTSCSSGTPADGRLGCGRPLPPSGPGHGTYSYLGAALGRQYVHEAVRDALLAAFARLHERAPRRRVLVGETGKRHGGPFPPHRTHQSGLSVDLFMPVDDGAGPATIPTWPWRRFGYGWDFDAQGRLGALRIDFEAVAQLLQLIAEEAPRRGLRVRTVIIAPEYVPLLLATPTGRRLGALEGALTRRPVWIRHDEHLHIDFALAGP